MTDQDLLSELQYALLEPVNAGASWTGELWSTGAVTSFLNGRQDTLLRDTGIQITRPGALATLPNTARHVLPQDWMATRRMVWHSPTPTPLTPGGPSGFLTTLGLGSPGDLLHFLLVGLGIRPPAPQIGRYTPLPKAGWHEIDHADTTHGFVTTARPLVYSEPEDLASTLEVEVSPSAYDGGVLEPWIMSRGTPLSNIGVTLTLPDAAAPLLKYGVLADMLSTAGRGGDAERATYCESRYQEGLQVIQQMFLAGWR